MFRTTHPAALALIGYASLPAPHNSGAIPSWHDFRDLAQHLHLPHLRLARQLVLTLYSP
jgi:hypothetical protein